MDGIPTYRTDQELPGIPLEWLQADGVTPVPLSSMGAILKFQIVRQKAVVVEQTAEMSADDVSPNWVMEKFTSATLDAVADDLDDRSCSESLYSYVPMYRRTADSADDIFDPPDGFVIRFVRAPT